MRPGSTSLVIVAAVSAGLGAPSYAADTPHQAYDHYVDCASHMLAAQSGAAHQDAKGAAESPKMDAMLKAMREKAVVAGAALSIPADRVSLRIDQDRDRLIGELNQPDPAKARQARKDVGMTTLSCAFDELGKAIAARKAAQQPAAPQAR